MDEPRDFVADKSEQIFQQMEAREFQRKEQQGLGREIISIDHQGQKFVTVGTHLLFSKNWNTFYDFLADYIKNVLELSWGAEEMKKDFRERHPIVQWYQYCCEWQEENKKGVGVISSATHIGASAAYYGLAYNLYLLHHNEGIQAELVRRVKLSDMGNFYGALYETYVAAHFIKAGFELSFENELDGSTTHCEFTATHLQTGRKFSVEAKVLAPKKTGRPNVISKMNAAFAKKADHERIIFIDIGKPASNVEESKKWLFEAQKALRELETNPLLNGQDLPSAYVIFTNNSFWYDLKGHDFAFAALGEGFKIPSFKSDYKDTVHNALINRARDKEVLDLIDSMRIHNRIPITFDGENPELALNPVEDDNPSLIIGQRYLVPSDNGDRSGTLRQVIVHEGERNAVGLYDLDGGGSSLVNHPLSDRELAAYKLHPRTFFGKIQPKSQIDDPLEFYDWVYNCHKHTPKERLLEFMKHYPNAAALSALTQEELAKIYCEGVTEAATMDNPQITK